jgi:hypothetical protein
VTLQIAEDKPVFSVTQVQVINGYAYLVINNTGSVDAHNVRLRCELELIEGGVSGETVFPLRRWKVGEQRKFAVRFKTNIWYRYFDTSPIKVTIKCNETLVKFRLE